MNVCELSIEFFAFLKKSKISMEIISVSPNIYIPFIVQTVQKRKNYIQTKNNYFLENYLMK